MNITLAALAFSTLALTGCDSNAAQPQNTEQPHISAEMKQRHDALQKEIQKIRASKLTKSN